MYKQGVFFFGGLPIQTIRLITLDLGIGPVLLINPYSSRTCGKVLV